MIINYLPEHFDLEEEARINQVLIAIRYTGPKSSLPASKFNRDAAFPSFTPLQGGPEDPDGQGRLPGPPQGAVVPDWTDDGVEDRTVEALEADEHIQVYYDSSAIAECMLESNYLDPNVFGRGFDADLRDFVFDELGLADVGTRNESEYRKQLREIAGVDADEEELGEETRDDSRVTQYREDHSRAELKDAAGILGYEDENAGKIAFAEFLADQPRDAVRFAFGGKAEAARDAAAGEDIEAVDPLTAGDAEEQYDHDELKAVVKSVREGTGEFSLKGAGADDMATFLVEDKGLTEAEIDAELTEGSA